MPPKTKAKASKRTTDLPAQPVMATTLGVLIDPTARNLPLLVRGVGTLTMFVATWTVSEKLQSLSGNSLWLPPEKRQFIAVVGGLVGVVGLWLGIAIASIVARWLKGGPRGGHEKQAPRSKVAAGLIALLFIALAVTLYFSYFKLAQATTQEVQTTWGDASGKDGLQIEFGSAIPAGLQQLGAGNYRIRIPRTWSPEDREFWLHAALDLPGQVDEASAPRRGLTAKFSVAPVEAIERIANSSYAQADLIRQNRWFLCLHLFILLFLAVGSGIALDPIESALESVFHWAGGVSHA